MSHSRFFRNTARRSAVFSFALSLLIVLFASCSASAPQKELPEAPPIVVISLDGMADWIVDELLAEGKLPNIARVIANGGAADHGIGTFPAKTAVAHCSMWTGTNPSFNGIHANGIIPAPYAERTIVDTISGFDSTGLQAEPVWVSAANQGRKVISMSATQGAPFEKYTGSAADFPADPGHLLMFDGYRSQALGAGLVEADQGLWPAAAEWANLPEAAARGSFFESSLRDQTFSYLFFDDPDDPAEGFDTLWICTGRDGETLQAELKPAGPNPHETSAFSRPVEVRIGDETALVYFRLFELSPTGSQFRLFHSQAHFYRSTREGEAEKLIEASGGFVGNAGWSLFLRGDRFGKTVFEGGDGSVERAYTESVRHSMERFRDAMVYGLKEYDFDLMLGYLPYPDGPNHAWLGYAAEPVGSREHPIGKLLWLHLLDVYAIVDEFVGAVYDAMPEDGYLFVLSDHGFASTDHAFHVNNVLRQAGLLTVDENGRIDPSRSKAVYHLGNGSFVWINDERFLEGPVAAEERDAVMNEVRNALLEVTGVGGEPVVEAIYTQEELGELNMSGPFAGDLYLSMAGRYYAVGSMPTDGALISPFPLPGGNHFGDPRKRLMNSIFIFGGKKGPLDVTVQQGRTVDLAPTVSDILGIAPPKDATGKPLTELVTAILTQWTGEKE